MSVRVTAELNPLSAKRIAIDVNPGSIKEIIDNFKTGWPLSQARVCLNGEIIKDFSVKTKSGDTLSIKFVPYGDNPGAGMKIGGWALIALGIGAFFIPGIGGFLGAALIGSGLSMTLGGTVLMNTNISSLNDQEKPVNDPSIRGGKNQSRPHGRIPVLFGTHRIYPDLAANPHTEIIDGKQYYTQLFCGGYKDCVIDIESFKLGDTPLVDFSGTKNINQIFNGADPVIALEILQNGEQSVLYPNCVHEEMLNTPLSHEIDGPDNQKMPGDVIRTTPDKTDTINIDIFFLNGLGKYNDEGDLLSASVNIQAWYKLETEPDTSYQSLGFFNNTTNTISGSELKTKRYQITKSGLTPGQYTVKIERVTEDSEDSKIVDQVHIGSIRSFKSKRPIRYERQKELTIIALKVLATSQLSGVLDSFNYTATAKIPIYSGEGTGHNYWLQTAETKNPAAALLYVLQGRSGQQKVSNDDIDWQALEAFYLWCEEHEYFCNAYLSQSVTIAELMKMIGSTSRADVIRIDSKISVIQDIERPSPMQLFTPKNSIEYKITMLKGDIPDAISLRYIDEDAGYIQNELSIYNTPNGERIKEPETDQKVELWGITNYKQVQKIGMYNYACLKNRPFVHTIDSDIEYMVVNKGDWIQYAGDIALAGTTQGRIKGLVYIDDVCVGIDTDEPIEMESGKTYAVRIRTSKGVILLKEVVYHPGIKREHDFTYYPGEEDEDCEPTVGDFYAIDEDENIYYKPENVILFVEPLNENEIIKAGDIYAFGVRGYEVIDLIITDIQPGRDLTATLTCVEYAPEIFGVDEPDFVLPSFVNKITPVSGAVDSGVVNPKDWKRFAVFHDNEEEPPRPAGDGQSDGWYYEQTYRSIWQSTKISKSIDDGEWGAPVRIRAFRNDDDIKPVWLTVTPAELIMEVDKDGQILADQLPATLQANLHKWNTVLFEPVIFSLQNTIEEITINENGIITINENIEINDEIKIILNAEYQDVTYNTSFKIIKNKNKYIPRYLGKAYAQGSINGIVEIWEHGDDPKQVKPMAGDWVAYLGDDSEFPWLKGYCVRWTGNSWEQIPITPDGNFESNPYMQAMFDLTNEAPMGQFVSLLVQNLITKTAMIEALFSKFINIHGEGAIASDNFLEGVSGYSLPSNGKAVFNEEIYIYNLKVVSFEIIPPSGNGTLLADLIGFQSQNLTLEVGWYEVEVAGGGGGKGGDGRWYSSSSSGSGWITSNGGNGGNGGYVKHRFYNQYSSTSASLKSGGGGLNGASSSGYNRSGGGGGGGGGSVVEITNAGMRVLIVAGGGGGGGGGRDNEYGPGGGGGGWIGGGGGGESGDGFGGNGGGGGGSAGGINGYTGGNGGGISGGKGGGTGDGYYNYGKGGKGGDNSKGGDGGNGGAIGRDGGTEADGRFTQNAGGINNANGGNGFIKIYKLS